MAMHHRTVPLLNKRDGLEFFFLPALAQSKKACHAFFTRKGGASTGIYHSLNCGHHSSDSPVMVAENYYRAGYVLDLKASLFVKPHQTHSNRVAILNHWPLNNTTDLHVDGLVTTLSGITLSITTADCAPILLLDEKAGVIGACHAGWRGTCAGIVEATLAAMARLGARVERIYAGIGPCIGPQSYRVGEDVFSSFATCSSRDSLFFNPLKDGYWLFDLAGLIAARLKASKVKAVEIADSDNYSEPNDFFSYRYSYHHGLNDCGRLVSLISLL